MQVALERISCPVAGENGTNGGVNLALFVDAAISTLTSCEVGGCFCQFVHGRLARICDSRCL